MDLHKVNIWLVLSQLEAEASRTMGHSGHEAPLMIHSLVLTPPLTATTSLCHIRISRIEPWSVVSSLRKSQYQRL